MNSPPSIVVNKRTYRWPDRPLVVICVDGSEPGDSSGDPDGYMDRAIGAGCMPYLKNAIERGTWRIAECVVPSFTNPNNLSIVTGVPPSVHGICGNFFYDPVTDAEIMMNDPQLLRAPTILAGFAARGASVAVITAKDKLRRLLGSGLTFGEGGSVCFSAEKADAATLSEHGIENVLDLVNAPLPNVYSAQLSEFVFAAGLKLMHTRRPDILYLSTTDYVQHKHAAGSPKANEFYAMMDAYWRRLDEAGVTLAVTADHGMKAKHDVNGVPKVVYLQSVLDAWLGTAVARVICPITDPYVVHHGALGGFVTVYLPSSTDVPALLERVSNLEGIECALSRRDGCKRFELPGDRLGDILVVADSNTVIGRRPDQHDLTGLDAPLRSHGGLSEQCVPFVLNRPTPALSIDKGLRNYDIFDAALNYAR